MAELTSMFGYVLSQPIGPHDSENLYKPTQHLCDLVREDGYDGVLYPSAMGSGVNLVLFNDADGEPVTVSYVTVDNVEYTYDVLPEARPLYELGLFDGLVVQKGSLGRGSETVGLGHHSEAD